MKEKISRMLRSGVAMLLVLCMVAGFIPSVAFAAEVKDGNGDGIINYVSFGASNVNGYGLSGYMPAGTTAANKDTENVYGYQRMPVDSYPYLIAKALNEAVGGTVKSSYNGGTDEEPFSNVKVDQLAISSMRMEELRFLLDETYAGDKYTTWRFYNAYGKGWFAQAESAGLEVLRATYAEAITNADVITLDMGVNNFGVFMDRATKGLVDTDINAIDPEIAAQYAQAKAHVKTLVAQYSGEAALLLEGMDQMIDALAYTLVGFCTSFDAVMGKIQELNPNAIVVVVSIQNLLTDMELEMPGLEQTLPLGDIFGAVINAANLYTAGRSPYRDSYLYADIRQSGRVTFFVDDLRNYNGDPATITENMKDCFNIYGDELWKGTMDLEDQVLAMVDQFLAGEVAGAFDATEQGILAAIYGADVLGGFLADGANGFVKAEAALSGVLADDEVAVATKKYEDVYKTYTQMKAMYQPLALDMVYDVLHELFSQCVQDSTINFAAMALDGPTQGAIENALLGAMVTEAVGAINQLAVDPTYKYDVNEHYPDGFLETIASGAGVPLSIIKTVACMGVRTGMGNSFYGHPTPYGHQEIANVILKTLEEDVTGDDIVEAEVKIVLNELYDLVQEYGPEVAAQVWQQWVDAGYVADVEDSINELLATLETRYEYYTTEALPAIDASVLELLAQKDALVVELDALKTELAAKKAELEKVVSEQEISDIYAPNINIDGIGGNEQTNVPENECVVESATIKGELEAAIRDIEHAIATIEALIADIEADVADMVALAEQIAAAVAELEKHMQSIAVAAKDLNAAVLAVAEVLENSNGIVDSVLKTFEAGRETVLAAAKVLDLAIGTANEMTADIDGMIAEVVADAEALYNKVVADLPAALAQMPTEMYYALGVALYASQYVDVAAIDLALQAKAAEYGITEETLTEEYITGKIAEIAAEYGVTEETVIAKYLEVTGKIDTYITENYEPIEIDTDAQIEALKKEADLKIEALELELEGYKAQLAELAEDVAEEIKAPILAQIERVSNDIATVNADLEHAVAHLQNAADIAYQQIVAEALKIYEDAKEAVLKQIEALEEQIKIMLPDLDAAVEGIKAAVEAAKITVESILNANIESVEDLKNVLVALGVEEAAKLVQTVVDQINAIFKKATSSDLVLHDDFKYVAIGDGSAATESYVEKLAAELNAEAASKGYNEISYVNNAKANNTVAAERANLSDVTGADLITVGFSNVTFLSDALTKFINGIEIDWANYVGEENVEYVDELLAEVDAKLAESIADEATRAYVMNIAEAYAYSAVEYAVELPALINEINAVNSDALVIIVGMYNPLENVTIALDETTTLDIGEYVDYLVKGVAVHGVAYSLLTGNAIYVDAPAVETAVTGKTLGLVDLLGLLTSNFAGMYPTEAGHEYIKNQILNALDLDTDLLGDADGNGKITTNDAKLVLQYIVKLIGADKLNLKVCDVDGNGSITTNDAKLILQYIVKLINKFPAEA